MAAQKALCLAIQVNCTPKVALYSSDSHENLIKVEGIAVTRMLAPKPPRVFRAEFYPPQSDRLAADHNATLGHQVPYVSTAWIEKMIEPIDVLSDFRRKNEIASSFAKLGFSLASHADCLLLTHDAG